MAFRKPMIALLALTTTLTTGFTLAAQSTQAQVARQGRDRAPVQSIIQAQLIGNFTAPTSAIGEWKGGMHSKGDDAVTSLRLQIKSSPSGYQGSWQVLGAAGVLQQGSLSGNQQGNSLTLTLEKFNGNTPLVLHGTMKPGGTSVSGQVNNSNFIFFLSKS